MQKQSPGEIAVRSVVGIAREVRLQMRDATVIFATILVADGDDDTFSIRPWGVRIPVKVQFEAVSRAAAVRMMLWKQQRDISAAQSAGDFSGTVLRSSHVEVAAGNWRRASAANDNRSASEPNEKPPSP